MGHPQTEVVREDRRVIKGDGTQISVEPRSVRPRDQRSPPLDPSPDLIPLVSVYPSTRRPPSHLRLDLDTRHRERRVVGPGRVVDRSTEVPRIGWYLILTTDPDHFTDVPTDGTWSSVSPHSTGLSTSVTRLSVFSTRGTRDHRVPGPTDTRVPYSPFSLPLVIVSDSTHDLLTDVHFPRVITNISPDLFVGGTKTSDFPVTGVSCRRNTDETGLNNSGRLPISVV